MTALVSVYYLNKIKYQVVPSWSMVNQSIIQYGKSKIAVNSSIIHAHIFHAHIFYVHIFYIIYFMKFTSSLMC